MLRHILTVFGIRDTTDRECVQCEKSPADFYSLYNNKRTLFCSSECHQKYNDQKAHVPNPVLIELEEVSDQKEETEVNDVFKACHRGEENHRFLQSHFNEHGANPNQVNSKGQTLLTYAIAKGDVRTLDILLLAGADINARDESGDTALMVAAQLESEIKIEYLLDKGALTDVVDAEGKTALHRTEQNKTSTCAKLLIDKDPSLVNITDQHQHTVLHLVAGEGNEELIRCFLEHESKRDELDNLGRTPLHWAVIQGMKSNVEILLDNDATTAIDVRDKLGFYPIHYAVQINRPDIVRHLVDKGCNLTLTDFPGRTPFVFAASAGHRDICEIILEKHAGIESSDVDGLTALHFAASRGDSALCRLLLDLGATSDPTNHKGETPLHLATTNQHTDVIELLINNGSRGVSIQDAEGRTPIHYAVEWDYQDILQILVKEITMSSKLHTTDDSKDHNSTTGVFNLKDNNNHTALYLAASRDYNECCEVLLEHGASVDEEAKPYLTQMGLIQPDEVRAPSAEDSNAMTAKERYAPSLSPPLKEPLIEADPVTDKEAIANTSRHIHDDVISTRTNKNSRKSQGKSNNWTRFLARRKLNKEKMLQTTRAIPQKTGSPYLVSQVDRHILRRNLIGQRTAHDIYSEDEPTNQTRVYRSHSQPKTYSYSRDRISSKSF